VHFASGNSDSKAHIDSGLLTQVPGTRCQAHNQRPSQVRCRVHHFAFDPLRLTTVERRKVRLTYYTVDPLNKQRNVMYVFSRIADKGTPPTRPGGISSNWVYLIGLAMQ